MVRRPGNAPGGSGARLFYRQISLFTKTTGALVAGLRVARSKVGL